ncbi:MAG: flagellar M-ring protein FliF, partial [Ignavibacteria bacterium]
MKNSLFTDITGIFNKLAPAQKMLLGGVAVTSVILMIVLLTMLNEPNYSTLYSHLAPEDASKVIDELNTQKIPYKLEANGETIKVPKDNVYELRLSLAAKGVPNSGVVGYEIFDKSTIGMSEFMQKLNYRRALEGELARTIMQQDAIEAARVHLVFPKKAVFKEDEIEPTASVVIKEKGSRRLKQVNIEAIQNLVAGSVEGMNPNSVTVIDTKGRLLSKERGDDSFAASSSKQYEVKKNVEKYLIEKAQTILDNVLGAGNAIVQVDASLNFSQVEKQMEIYDPEGQVVVSEQTVKNSNVGHNVADSTANVSENVTTNYETGKTIQRVVEESGNITKLSIAAVINHARKEVKEGEEVKVVYEPRSQEEIDKLAAIIRNAVGFYPARGDQLSIESVPFEPQMNEGIELESPSSGEFFDINNMDKLINLIIVV